MDFREYLRILRRHWRIAVSSIVLSVATAAGLTIAETPVYAANTQFFVSARESGSADIGSTYTGGLFVEQRVKSYASILSTRRVAQLVIDDLDLEMSVGSLSKQISGSAPIDTVLIDVSVKDTDPVRARDIANSLGRVFPRFVEQIERNFQTGEAPVQLSVVQTATTPALPTTPRPKLNLAIALLFGTVLGVGLSVVRELLDSTVKNPELAEELVGAPMLGAITFDADATTSPLVTVTAPNSVRAEAFRQMRTNLQFIDIQHSLRSVVVTSSVPGEGKTTTSCNLAISLAQAGVRVALIEGDLRRPKVASYMGLEGAVGLTSVLLGRITLDDALQHWGGSDWLSVLTSGPLPPNPSELLGSAGMTELIDLLQARFDVVILDAPPLLPVTDAAVLGAMTSGLLMVVRSGRTRREQLQRATATARQAGALMLGTILNAVPTSGPDARAYGYGYGYGYKAKAGNTPRLTSEESTLARASGQDTRGSWSSAPDVSEPEGAASPASPVDATEPTSAMTQPSPVDPD